MVPHVSQPPSRSPAGDSPADVTFQNQAVLRRATRSTALALVGVTLDSKFYPDSPVEATGTLELTKGLVALAPLTAVHAVDAAGAAVIAQANARESWGDLEVAPPDEDLHS